MIFFLRGDDGTTQYDTGIPPPHFGMQIMLLLSSSLGVTDWINANRIIFDMS
jgi:hypothetical protein